MNLLVKIRNCGALILCLAFFNSCEEKGSFGLASDDVAPVEFVSTTVDLSTSMLLLDSVRTSRFGRILFGEIEDPAFGRVTATGYKALSARTAVQPDIPETAQLDSVQINFRISYLYDTSSNNRDLDIELYNIGEAFKDTLYINSNSLQQGNLLIASGNFNITNLDSTYVMDADMTWGQEFFEGVRTENSNFTDQTNFRNYFPGFVIKSINNGNIFSITPGQDFEVIFYYQQPNADNSGIVNLSFIMNGEGMPYFHNVVGDRSATGFSEIQDVSTVYENTLKLGVQTGVGLAPKINFDNLTIFSDNNPGIIINQAEMTLGPIDDLPDGVLPPAALVLYITDDRNTPIPNGDAFRAIQVDGANPVGSGNPVQFFYNSEDRLYRASITSYVQAYYKDDFRRNKVILYPSEMNSSIKSFTLGRDKVQLRIFYSELR